MSVFSQLFGKDESSKIISKLDDIINNIPDTVNLSNDKFDTIASNAVKEIINYQNKDSDGKEPSTQIEQLFNGITVPKERLNRYSVYDELYKGVPLIKRIFSVYTGNVFQKDTITNKIFYTREHTKLREDPEIEKSKKVAELITKYFNLEENIKHFVGHNTFKYGDAFIEVINLDNVPVKFPVITKKDQTITSAVQTITETREIIENGKRDDDSLKYIEENLKSKNKYKRQQIEDHIEKLAEYLVEIEDFGLDGDIINEAKSEDLEVTTDKLKKVVLRYHKPHRIIPLVTPYNIVLGFIELKTIEKQASTNTFQRFLDIVEKISAIGSEKSNLSIDSLLEKFTEYTIKKILSNYKVYKGDKQSYADYEQSIKDSIKDDLFYSIKATYLGLKKDNLYKNKLSLRFIEVDNMFWFKMPSAEHYPFGTSLIDPLTY